MRTRRPHLIPFLAVVWLALAGCGEDDPVSPPPPPALPANTTPEGAVQRFIAAYEQKKSAEYQALLTGDFTFEFSNHADPELVQRFASGWFQADEAAAARNLFQGGTNGYGEFQPGASRIELDLAQNAPVADTSGGKDGTKHKVLLTPVTLTIDVPPRPGESEGTTYQVGAGLDPAMHRLFLVRGDAAVGLGPGQPADSSRWYIWRWLDETASTSAPTPPGGGLAPATPAPADGSTWGRLKALYWSEPPPA